MFEVRSTSTITRATQRTIRVLQRSHVAPLIAYAGVFNCRYVSGTSVWSDHAWGAAVDLFPRGTNLYPEGTPEDFDEILRRIFHGVIMQATRRTRANRGRPLRIRYVIDHQHALIWTPSAGVHHYSGTVGPHVHVSTGREPTGTPPCARSWGGRGMPA